MWARLANWGGGALVCVWVARSYSVWLTTLERRKMQKLIGHITACLMVVLVQVVEDGYEFFAKRQLVTLFSAPNYCGEFDNAGAMMSVDETLMCSFQVRHIQRDLSRPELVSGQSSSQGSGVNTLVFIWVLHSVETNFVLLICRPLVSV